MPSNRVSNIENRSAAIAMASAETITFESHPGWTLQARFFRDVKNAEEVGNLIVAGKLPVKTSVINAKLVPGERELRRIRKEGRKAHERARVRYPLGPGVPQRARPAGRRRSRSRSCSQKQGAPPPLTRPQQWTDSWPRMPSLFRRRRPADVLPLYAAGDKTLRAHKSQKGLTTRTLGSELVFNLSGSKHIREALTKFGVKSKVSWFLGRQFFGQFFHHALAHRPRQGTRF